MSMNTYPLEAPLAFHVDEQTAAFLLRSSVLAWLREKAHAPNATPTPEQTKNKAVRAILEDDTLFRQAVQPGSEAYDKLNDYDLFSVSDATDLLQHEDIDHVCYMSEFQGEIQKLDHDGHATGESISCEDDYVLFILPDKETSPFRAAYESMQEFIDEVKDKLSALLPDSFDYASRVVSVSGTYFC